MFGDAVQKGTFFFKCCDVLLETHQRFKNRLYKKGTNSSNNKISEEVLLLLR